MESKNHATALRNAIVDKDPEADARAITEGLGGTWYTSSPGQWRTFGKAPCPVCQPEGRADQRALYVEYRVGCVPVFCKGAGCSVTDIVKALRQRGLLTGVREVGYYCKGSNLLDDIERDEERSRRQRRALHIWEGSQLIQGTPAEDRLRKMGITCPLPDTLRYHSHCWHPDGTQRPAMVARLKQASWELDGVHITYLPQQGMGEDVGVTELLLGDPGQLLTIVDHPYEAMTPIVVAESISSALALASGLLEGPARIRSALSPEGMAKAWLPEKFKMVDDYWWWNIELPCRLIVVREGGEESRAAAEALAEEASSHGWTVEFLTAWEDDTLVDMLDDERHLPHWKLPPPDGRTFDCEMKEQNVTKTDLATSEAPVSVAASGAGESLLDDAAMDAIPY